jgi:endoglycosylceramidase
LAIVAAAVLASPLTTALASPSTTALDSSLTTGLTSPLTTALASPSTSGLTSPLTTGLASPLTAHAATPTPAPDRALSFLHVGPAAGPSNLPQVLDAQGREVLLRGVNIDGIVDYFRTDLHLSYPTAPSAYTGGACPPNDSTVEGVRICDFDLTQVRPLGYNTIRLNISWSLLETQPGVVDSTYLDRIAQVVGWARAQGIYVVLDMHQDAWSKYVFTPPGQTCPPPFGGIRGYDGAPDWASVHTTPACAINGTRELDPAVQEDFQRLWSDTAAPDGVGLQEHYAAVMLALAQRFGSDPTVAGYEIMNEPSPGFVAPPASDAAELFPFYAKVIGAVTTALPGFHQLFLFEPDVTRDLTDQRATFAPWSTYSSYPNVVYAPHIYSGTFTIDALLGAPSPTVFPVSQGYANAVADAAALGLPVWVGEFGNDPAQDDPLLEQQYQQQDALGVPGALWLWKENRNDTQPTQFWGIYGPPFGTGTLQTNRVRITSRAYPEAVAGTLQSMSYDDHAFTFDIRATSPAVAAGDLSHATLVFVPAAVTGDVVATGADLQVFDRGGGSREVYVFPRGGAYHVFLAAPSTGVPEAPWIPGLLLAAAATAIVARRGPVGLGRRPRLGRRRRPGRRLRLGRRPRPGCRAP